MTTYTHWDVLLASPTEPLPLKKRQYQMDLMRKALENCKTKPSVRDIAALATAVDLMDTLREMGHLEDSQKALEDAMIALMQDNFNDIEVRLFEGILEDYQMVMDNLPARTMIAAHRETEKRLSKQKVAA
jgi:kynureninase